MNLFVRLMTSPIGRVSRAAAGGVLLGAGLFGLGGLWGAVAALLATVPLAAGTFDICVFSPLLRLPLSGARIRAMR